MHKLKSDSIGRSSEVNVEITGEPPSLTSIQRSGFAKLIKTQGHFSTRNRALLYLFRRVAVVVWGAVLLC